MTESTMLVYGIQCSDMAYNTLQPDLDTTYYPAYGLLVFSSYTKPLTLRAHGRLSPAFWSDVKQLVENPQSVHRMDFEHPYISDAEDNAVRFVKGLAPAADVGCYSIPV